MQLSLLLGLLLLPASPILSVPTAEAAALPDIHTYASTTAQRYGLDPSLFAAVISCESGWNPTAVSPTRDYGIVQVHLSAHPELTLDQVDNPYFAINWMAQAWEAGHENWWTCFKIESVP